MAKVELKKANQPSGWMDKDIAGYQFTMERLDSILRSQDLRQVQDQSEESKVVSGRATAARKAHNLQVDGSNPSPTSQK